MLLNWPELLASTLVVCTFLSSHALFLFHTCIVFIEHMAIIFIT